MRLLSLRFPAFTDLGSPEFYEEISLKIKVGDRIDREKFIQDLVEMHYIRSEVLARGRFRVQGETIEIVSPSREIVTRVEIRRRSGQKNIVNLIF